MVFFTYVINLINGDSSVRRLPLGCGALGVDHDALDEDRDHHELDALALHNPLVSPSMPYKKADSAMVSAFFLYKKSRTFILDF